MFILNTFINKPAWSTRQPPSARTEALPQALGCELRNDRWREGGGPPLRGGRGVAVQLGSSPGIHRFFAGCCGSPIHKRHDAVPEVLGLRLGTLDTDPARTVEQHFSVSSKAPWVEIEDSLPQIPGGAPFGERD